MVQEKRDVGSMRLLVVDVIESTMLSIYIEVQPARFELIAPKFPAEHLQDLKFIEMRKAETE